MSKAKFVATDIAVTVMMLIVLLSNFSLFGLVATIIGTGLLFAGTLADNDKTDYGVSNKFGFYVFMSLLTIFGILTPVIFDFERKFVVNMDSSVWIAILSFVLFIVFASVSTSVSMNPYLRRIFKYLGLFGLSIGIYAIVNKKLTFWFLLLVVAAFFMICDMYCMKSKADDPEYHSNIKPDNAYWMALLINTFFIFVEMGSRGFLNVLSINVTSKSTQVISHENVDVFFSSSPLFVAARHLFSGLNVFIFILIMVVLTIVYICLDKDNHAREYHDSYLLISLAGCTLLFRTYLLNLSFITGIVFLFSIITYVYFGFGMRGIKKNGLIVKSINRLRCVPIIVSVCITLFFLLSIILFARNFVVPWISLVVMAILLVVLKKHFLNSWWKTNMYWQIILLCLFCFSLTIFLTLKNPSFNLLVLLYMLVFCSAVNWISGMNNFVVPKGTTASTIVKVVNCVAMGCISLFVAI